MGREFQAEGTASTKAVLQRGLGMFKEQLGDQWGWSDMRVKVIGHEVRETVGPRSHRAL